MGSQHSLTYIAFKSDEIPLLFSDLHKALKKKKDYRHFARKIKLDCNRYSVTPTMSSLVHLWYVSYLSRTKCHSLLPHLRDRMIRDFINTLYCTSSSFDEIFLLLFTNAKSRYMLEQNRDLGLSSEDLKRLAEDFLRYASTAGLQFYVHKNQQKSLENLVDYPLKTFSLCPCTKRPLYVALYLRRPDTVRLLLNCGARIPYEDICNCNGRNAGHPLQNVLDIMKAPIKNSIASDTLDMLVYRERCVESLNILLVDMSYTSPLWSKLYVTLGELKGQECEIKFPSLKHISRAYIRLLLRNSRSLPQLECLAKLGLPHVLVSYLYIDDTETL
ncbi:hypothetical protein JTE90_028648 [Oedothorax gibbosus]|uniref:SOCS box domain-containing protein n=1 Tax=Oedothorax gibbosus TaxID=931172 RepID=A0AAV6UX89_9ARAC|nr:hypothetical protein JTE90_028648 [Oedothorax gibbosus]